MVVGKGWLGVIRGVPSRSCRSDIQRSALRGLEVADEVCQRTCFGECYSES